MKTTTIACQECGKPVERRRIEQTFCCTPCRQRFNNRRMQRGAELYDLFRAMRRERTEAARLDVWTMMCRLEKQWNDEDAGRKTWTSPKKALANLVDKGSIQRGETLVYSYLPGRAN